jgi:acyl-CoA hydrolase
MDALVGMVAYRYCNINHRDSEGSITLVTLSVNNFFIHSQDIRNDLDLLLNSYITYVGRSSMEIATDVYQAGELVGTVSFVMVARDPLDYAKSAQVRALDIESEVLGIKELC